jgi:3-deoxy-D-manno-octulosonate 8-phosphate phosphatase (KDO 8-P phosphatase)
MTRLAPAQLSDEQLRIVRGLKLLVLDFDGVLTDNHVIVGSDGSESVRCWRGDGYGMKAVEKLGVTVVILSSELVPVVKARAKKLGVRCECTDQPKQNVLAQIIGEVGCTADETAFVGNDINDAGCLGAVGMPIVVKDCHPDVQGLAKLQTTIPGGFGAVREVCDLIVRVQSAGQ